MRPERPIIRDRNPGYNFVEVVEFAHQFKMAFSCDDFETGQFIAFDEETSCLTLYSGGVLADTDKNFTIEVEKFSVVKEKFVITLDCFEKEWHQVTIKEVTKIYKLEVNFDLYFKEKLVIENYNRTFSDLSREEKIEFLYGIVDKSNDANFKIDGVEI